MSPFRDDCLEPDEPDRPEAAAKCFTCGRQSVATDICVHCSSPLMYSEDTIVRIAANRSGMRAKPKRKKR